MNYVLNPLFNHFLTGTNQCDPLPDMIEARSSFSAVTYGSSVFAIGGHNGADRWLGEVEQYNFEEQVWRPYTTLVTPRSGSRCVQTLVTTIITCGMVQVYRVRGQGVRPGRLRRHLQTALSGVLHPRTSWQQTCVASGEASDCGPAISKEAQVADMLEPRSNFSVAVIDNRLMVMGGYR